MDDGKDVEGSEFCGQPSDQGHVDLVLGTEDVHEDREQVTDASRSQALEHSKALHVRQQVDRFVDDLGLVVGREVRLHPWTGLWGSASGDELMAGNCVMRVG